MKKITNALSKAATTPTLWAFWIWNGKISIDEMERQLNEFVEKGFAGVAIRPADGMMPIYLSEEFMELFGELLILAKDAGIKIRIADEFGMCKNGIFQNIASKNRQLRAGNLTLTKKLYVAAGDKFTYPVKDKNSVIVLATKLIGSRSDLKTVRDLTKTVRAGMISWKVPAGEWAILVLTKKWQLDPIGNYLPNTFNSRSAQFYSTEILTPFIEKFSKFTPSIFEGFVNEMPSIHPAQNSIPWDDDLITKYKSRYKKDLIKILPALFMPVLDDGASNRGHVYNFISQSSTEKFAGTLEAWAKKNKMSQWTLFAERDLSEYDNALTEVLATTSSDLQTVGIQNQEGTLRNAALVKAIGDINTVEYKRDTIGVIGRNRKNRSSTLQELKTEIELHADAGASNIILDGCFYAISHKNFIKTPFNPFWYHSEWESVEQLTSYANNIISVSKATTKEASVAVLFPASSAMADYLPSGNKRFQEALQFFRDTVLALRAAKVEFDILSESFISSCTIKATGTFSSSAKVRKGSYSTIILPYSRLINNSTFVFLEKLAIKKGKLIFINEAPVGNFDDGQSASFETRVRKIVNAKAKSVHQIPTSDIKDILEEEEVISPISITTNGKVCERVTASIAYDTTTLIATLTNSDELLGCYSDINILNSKYLYSLDMETGVVIDIANTEKMENGSISVSIQFQPLQTIVLLTSETKLTGISSKESKIAPLNLWGTQEKQYSVVLKSRWKFKGDTLNALPLASWKARMGLSRETGGFTHYYESFFEVEDMPNVALLSFMDSESGDSIKDFSSLEILVNGTVVSPYEYYEKNTTDIDTDTEEIDPELQLEHELRLEKDTAVKAFYLDNIIKYDIHSALNKGVNRVAIRTLDTSKCPETLVYPVMIAGDFSIKKGQKGWKISNPETDAEYGTWVKNGYPFLSGTGTYKQVFEVPTGYDKVILNIGSVSGIVSVKINEKLLDPQCWQPLLYDITDLVEQRRNELEIKVYNTPENILRMSGSKSGLIGECHLDIYKDDSDES